MRNVSMEITVASHLDHNLSPAHVALIRERFGDRTAFFLETITLPPELPDLLCNLHGPATGEDSVLEAEVSYEIRGNRKGPSRLCKRQPVSVRVMTVIGGPHEGECILYTAYGGPVAPREPWDETLDVQGREEATAFWTRHALGSE
jgi:hypothetical protein